MRRFGPSGSWKKKNNALEHTNAVTTRRSNDVRFDSNGILVIIEYFAASVPLAVAPPLRFLSNGRNEGLGYAAFRILPLDKIGTKGRLHVQDLVSLTGALSATMTTVFRIE